jgi:glycosyltransferase involved in cell wall biosynthesis
VDACEGKVVISLLHHHMDDVDEDHIAETKTPPWNFRVASALANNGNCRAIAIRPTNLGKFLVKTIENVIVILVPYKIQNLDTLGKIINKLKVVNLYKFMSETGYINDVVDSLVNKNTDIILHINEYKNIRYYDIFKKFRTYPFILQQHSRKPFTDDLASYYKIKSLRKLPRSAYFVLSVYELETLRSLKLGRYIKLRPMGVDVHRIQLINPKTKCEIRQRLNLPCDATILSSYLSNPILRNGSLYDVKGAHFLPIIIRYLNEYFKTKNIRFLIFNISGEYRKYLESFGNVTVFPYLSHSKFLDYLAASDLYFLPAHKDLRYTGIQVTIIEALGMGVPVVSPTLIHVPDKQRIKDVGVVTQYLENTKDASKFARKLIYAIENINNFNPFIARQMVEMHYSWESFVKDFREATIEIIR